MKIIYNIKKLIRNPFFILIIIFIIFIVILIYINLIQQKKNYQPYFIQVKKNIDNSIYIEEFLQNSQNSGNPIKLLSGKKIEFITEKNKFLIYLINYHNNKFVKLELEKDITKYSFTKLYDSSRTDNNAIKINSPIFIKTNLNNNMNYISSFKDNTIYIIDKNNKLINNIKTGEGPTCIDIYINNKSIYGYVSNYISNTISILDLKNNKKIRDIKILTTPSIRSNDKKNEIDYTTLSIKKEKFSNLINGRNPSFVCVAKKKKILFVLCFTNSTIYAYDLKNNPENPTKINIDDNNSKIIEPTCIGITPQEDKIYITNSGNSTISIYNISKDNEITKGENIEIIKGENIEITKDENIEVKSRIYSMPYSINFNSTNKIGVILTNNGIYLIDTDNKNNLTLVNFNKKESEEIGKIESVICISYKNTKFLFINNNKGDLFIKKIKNRKIK